jgi:hypothetical protein
MKNSLLSLKTRRTALTLMIAGYQQDILDAEKKILDSKAELRAVELDLPVVSGTVDGLDEQWDKKNVSNKPVTNVAELLKGN